MTDQLGKNNSVTGSGMDAAFMKWKEDLSQGQNYKIGQGIESSVYISTNHILACKLIDEMIAEAELITGNGGGRQAPSAFKEFLIEASNKRDNLMGLSANIDE